MYLFFYNFVFINFIIFLKIIILVYFDNYKVPFDKIMNGFMCAFTVNIIKRHNCDGSTM